MDSELFEIETGDQPTVTDVTDLVARFCADRGDGLVSGLFQFAVGQAVDAQ